METETAYTECLNLMDYSVAVIPVTIADKSIDVFDNGYQPVSETDRKNWEACKFLFNFRPGAYAVVCLAYEGFKTIQKFTMVHLWGSKLWLASMKKRRCGQWLRL